MMRERHSSSDASAPQDANFYFFNPMWKICKYQVQGTQRFCADVDQIVKVSTREVIALRRSTALRGP